MAVRQGIGGPGSTGGAPESASGGPRNDLLGELGLVTCKNCGGWVIEGACLQCDSGAVADEPPVTTLGRSPLRCANCGSGVVTGGSFCDSCGEAVPAHAVALSNARAMRAKLDSLK